MKTCFVICPLLKQDTDVRRRSDFVLANIIKPVAIPFGYDVMRGDLVHDEKTIPDSISSHIFKDDLVIADLTDCNPNVFYELGKRHAWGGPCIHLTQDVSTLPFDIRHHRVIPYDLRNPVALDETRRALGMAIQAVQDTPLQCPFPMTPDRIIALTGATLLIDRHEGRRDHYYIAQRLAESQCRRMFLMQRSSTLILGPEQGWGAERNFYYALISAIASGTEFFHIVSLKGIGIHLARPQSVFPDAEVALARLSKNEGIVGISGPSSNWYFKQEPAESEDPDMKPDRQARMFLIERYDGETEGVIVLDLGGSQSCFHLRGPKIRDLFHTCLSFYHNCHLLRWSDLESINKLRGLLRD